MRKVLLGFIAGFLATIIFHQIALQLLHMAGMVPRAAWPMRPVPPLGVPAIIDRLRAEKILARGARLRRNRADARRVVPGCAAQASMMIGPIVNGVWRLGTALF